MAEAPDDARIRDGLNLYWSAFWRLSRGRPSIVAPMQTPAGMIMVPSPAPLPWETIATYADRLGLFGAPAEMFCELISALDDEYLTALREQSQA